VKGKQKEMERILKSFLKLGKANGMIWTLPLGLA